MAFAYRAWAWAGFGLSWPGMLAGRERNNTHSGRKPNSQRRTRSALGRAWHGMESNRTVGFQHLPPAKKCSMRH